MYTSAVKRNFAVMDNFGTIFLKNVSKLLGWFSLPHAAMVKIAPDFEQLL